MEGFSKVEISLGFAYDAPNHRAQESPRPADNARLSTQKQDPNR